MKLVLLLSSDSELDVAHSQVLFDTDVMRSERGMVENQKGWPRNTML